jgi:hypothetical protein
MSNVVSYYLLTIQGILVPESAHTKVDAGVVSISCIATCIKHQQLWYASSNKKRKHGALI